MKDSNKVDLGSIKIHKKVLADITHSAVSDIPGVKLVKEDFGHTVKDLLGMKSYPGIVITVEKNNQVSIEVKVLVRYGINIPDLARQVQDSIRKMIEKTADIDLKDVHVNIQGIERGKP